ncbi:hypothetical protein OG279_09515 [Streptomyces sp. NBC_01201]|uniref:hypothetical protein n=1 Tax=Streptomyces sp. NBC_01201 TaxID=2903770 RepID=UPI002E10DF90|nr:hypothetical protein OG279_09515 [Streptomyces sp. NBC_01201]
MTTEPTAIDRLRSAAQRALESLDDLIAYTTDPGVEALGARHELARELSNTSPEVARRILGTTEQADTMAAPEVEAHPTLTEWIGEVQEGDDAWMFLGENSDRAFIEKRVANHHKRFSSWADGTPVNRRIVRKTTTYTVADEAQQPTPDVVEETVPACKCGHPQERHALLSGTYAQCRHKYTEAGRPKCPCGMYRPQGTATDHATEEPK